MPSKPADTHGVLAKVRSHLRGDRYMVDAWPPAPGPAPAPAPAPVVVGTPPAKEG